MKYLIRKLGVRFRVVRRLYFRLTKGSWLWGIVGWTRDTQDLTRFKEK